MVIVKGYGPDCTEDHAVQANNPIHVLVTLSLIWQTLNKDLQAINQGNLLTRYLNVKIHGRRSNDSSCREGLLTN